MSPLVARAWLVAYVAGFIVGIDVAGRCLSRAAKRARFGLDPHDWRFFTAVVFAAICMVPLIRLTISAVARPQVIEIHVEQAP